MSNGVFKNDKKAILPTYATDKSACFDLHACFTEETCIRVYTPNNRSYDVFPSERPDGNIIEIKPQHRYLVNTGLIFHLNSWESLRIHPRSGLSLKNGITIMNGEGVVDEDYRDEVKVILCNFSNIPFRLSHGDRICQAEYVNDTRKNIFELFTKPEKHQSRNGGFGSTGM